MSAATPTPEAVEADPARQPRRRRARRNPPPDTRQSRTAKFSVGGHKGYITVDMYEDGSPCAVTIRLAKMGSTMHGVFEWLSSSITVALQHGVPLRAFIAEMLDMQFEPSGHTGKDAIPRAKSIADFVARQLALWFDPAAVPEEEE